MAAGVWKILIVEDDEDDYFLTRELLAQARGQRYRFTWARTAAAARALLRGGGFDVVLMDERLPDGSGTALIREAAEAGSRTPMIMLTGRGSYELDLEAMRSGAADYLSKDEVTGPLLERAIRYALERQQAQAERERLQRENERQRRLFDSILEIDPGGIALVAGPDLVYQFANPAYRDQTPDPEIDPVGQPYASIWPEEDPFLRPADLRQVIESGHPEHYPPVTIVYPEGTPRSFTTHVYPLPEIDPTAALLVVWEVGENEIGVQRAFSEHGPAQSELRAAQARMEGLLQALPVAVWIVDAQGQTVAINEPATRLWTGNAPVPDEMGHYGAYKLYDPETGQELPVEERPLERAIAHGEVTSGRRYGMQRLDGSTGVILAFAGPIQTEDGETLGGVVVDLDITEQDRLEKINQEQKRELERSNRDLQDFASIISHDLKEPLRKITGFGELLTRRHRDSLDEEGRDYVERMVNAAERMQRMIDDMLEYSRVDTRGRPFEPVDLNQVTNEVLEDLDMRIEQTGGHVTVDPLPTIQADPGQMKHLLQNLIGNALKFHRPDTPPEVRVQARALNGREVELTVSDNGIGFDEESLGKLFMPFVRLHGRGEYEGSGMGLAICRRIAERHGGSITARSQPGQGSTFIVVLPKQPPKK